MQILLYSLLFGILAGFSYTTLKCFVILSNSHKIAYIISDIISMLIAGLLFAYCIIVYNSGIIRLYIVCAFAFGFLIEIVSIGNLVDFSVDFVYNKVKQASKTYRIKLRRKRNGAKTIK